MALDALVDLFCHNQKECGCMKGLTGQVLSQAIFLHSPLAFALKQSLEPLVHIKFNWTSFMCNVIRCNRVASEIYSQITDGRSHIGATEVSK